MTRRQNSINQTTAWLQRIIREGTGAIGLFVARFDRADCRKLRQL